MKTIVANWKLNPQSLKEAQKLISSINSVRTRNKVVICPPTPYIPSLKTKFELGAQDIFWQEQGPFTGQVSGSLLKQFKVRYAIVGHSERMKFGETDEEVNLKVQACIANKIQPILCAGYGLEVKQSDDDVLHELKRQLQISLKGVDPAKVIVAYEPVWAISTNKRSAENPEHAENVAMFLKIKFKVKKVIYGGSVNSYNVQAFADKGIDGFLVGAASLRPEEFTKIIQI